jgi:hypothetical protein
MLGAHAVGLLFGLEMPTIIMESRSDGVMILKRLNRDVHGSSSKSSQPAAQERIPGHRRAECYRKKQPPGKVTASKKAADFIAAKIRSNPNHSSCEGMDEVATSALRTRSSPSRGSGQVC